MSDDDDSHTMIVTIEIDDDAPPNSDKKEKVGDVEEEEIYIDPPLGLKNVKVTVKDSLLIRDLSTDMWETLCYLLDFPSYLSMPNWHAIGRHFQLEQYTLENMESSPSPMNKLLNNIADRPAYKLIEAIEATHRLDILYSIRRLMTRGKFERAKKHQDFLHSSTTSQYETSDIFTHSVSNPVENLIDYSNYVLVNHYEGSEKSETKNYRWFKKNILAHSQRSRKFDVIDVVDVENSGGNVFEKLGHIYKQVKHVLVCFSPEYVKMIRSGSDEDPATNFRRFVHQQTNAEFVVRQMKNHRCRVLLLSGCPQTDLETWACVTTIYTFPSSVDKLFDRLDDNIVGHPTSHK